jgi:hypothetical protein
VSGDGEWPGPPNGHDARHYTSGHYAAESLAAADLDAALERCGHLWRVYGEVPGDLLQPRPGQQVHGLKIDRLLYPRPALIAQGWDYGAVGIEIKRSGIKAGPCVAQAMDYTRALFRIPGGVQVVPSFVFVGPMLDQSGLEASMMAQQRVGTANWTGYYALKLKCGAVNLVGVERDGTPRLGAAGLTGRKVGAR